MKLLTIRPVFNTKLYGPWIDPRNCKLLSADRTLRNRYTADWHRDTRDRGHPKMANMGSIEAEMEGTFTIFQSADGEVGRGKEKVNLPWRTIILKCHRLGPGGISVNDLTWALNEDTGKLQDYDWRSLNGWKNGLCSRQFSYGRK